MSSKHKTNSFCKRLQRVYAAAIQQQNFDEYNESLNAFLQAINWPQYQTPPQCLVFPLGYFYYKKRPAGICSLLPFPFGRHQSYRVTNRTFPSLLRCQGMPEGPTEERNALLFTLKKLLQQYPYSVRDKLMTDIIRTVPNNVAYFLNFNVYVTSEKNLFYQTTKTYTAETK